MIAVIAALALAAAGAAQTPAARITDIRVHGNVTLADADVVRLAGLAVGDAIGPDTLESAASRLKASGRFDTVEIRRRYRTLAMDDVAIVLVVHEKPGLSASGEPPGPLDRLTHRLMFLPIVSFEDGYGFTYGGRVSTVDLLGAGERLSVPATWGGTRRIAFEAERTFDSGPFTRLFGSIGLSRRENPHFADTPDVRTTWFARAERRLPAHLMIAADVTDASVEFGPDHARFWSPGADVAYDTRRDPAYPSDAVLLQARWDSLRESGHDGIGRYSLDARGYKRVVGQTVAAVRARLDRADAPLPPGEAWLLGGAGSVRGIRAGAFAGDQRFVASAEVRV
ncbi:MAG TPA: POTRA domain-containing protein, partial [Vicinamibacterales bacterium]|nr:POTRA domain-containing protein [Vicinamibacterales bacterium]